MYTLGTKQSTFYFMNQMLGEAVTNTDVNQLLYTLIELGVLVCLVPLFFVLLTLAIRGNLQRKVETFKGKRCAHCSEPLPGEPTRAIAVGARNIYVYNCRRCDEETALTTPPTSG